jgi:hypothetical protein
MFTLRGGGAAKRPGARFIVDLASTAYNEANLEKFVFSRTEAYEVILTKSALSGPSWIKIYDNDGNLVTVDETERLDFSQVTDYDPNNWSFAQSADVVYMAYSDGTVPAHILARTAQDSFQFMMFGDALNNGLLDSLSGINEMLWRPYLAPNVDPDFVFRLSTELSGAAVLSMEDSGGTAVPFFEREHCFLTSGGFTTQHGAYFKATSGSTTGVCYIDDAFADIDIPDVDIVVGTDIITITGHVLSTGDNVIARTFGAGSPTGITIGTTYYARDVSVNTITLHPTLADAQANTNIVDITVLNGGGLTLEKSKIAAVTCNNILSFAAAVVSSGTDNWEESAWSAKQGFPRTFAIHEQRLVAGGTLGQPDTVFGSLVGNFFHFMESKLAQDASSDATGLNYFGTLVSSDPYQFTIASTEINSIQWISSLRSLQVGSLGAEYIVDGGPDQIISRDDISVSAQTSHGSAAVQPARINDALFFVSRDGKRLRDFSFSSNSRSFISSNISLLNDDIIQHLFDGLATTSAANIEIKKMVYQESRGILWILTSIGSLIGLTVDRDSEIIAWHRHTFSGTDAEVVSLTVVPNSTGTFDDLWLLMKRNINSTDSYYLEKMGGDFDHTLLKNSSTIDDDHPWFVDSAKRIKITDLADLTVSSVDTALNQISFGSAHGLEDGHKFNISSTGTLPGGLLASTDYYVGKVDNDTISVTASLDEAKQFIPTMNFVDGDVTVGSDQIDLTSHAYSTGDAVQLTTTGVLPAGLATSTTYYMIRVDGAEVQFATTLANANAGTQIDITAAAGGGTHTISPIIDRAVALSTAGSGVITMDLMAALTFNVDHLIGETVSVLADGFDTPDKTVSAEGTITLDEIAEEVIVGFAYTAELKTLRIDVPERVGTSQSQVKRIDEVTVRVYESLAGSVSGDNGTYYEPLVFRPNTLAQGDPLPLFSGDKVIKLTSSPDTKAQVLIRNTKPLPLTVVALIARGVSFD